VIAPTPLGELIDALAGGLAQPRHAWEAASIVAAWFGASVLSRAAVRYVGHHYAGTGTGTGTSAPGAPGAPGHLGTQASAIHARVESVLAAPGASAQLQKLLFPLIALGLLLAAEGLLRWRHVLTSTADARLLRLAVSLVGALAVVRVLFALMRRVFRSTRLISRLERLIGAVAILGIGLYATGVLEDVVQWLSTTEIPLGSAAQVSLWSLLVGSTTTLLALLGAMWLSSVIDARLDAETALEPNVRTVLGRVARVLLLVVAIMMAMALSGIDLTVLSVFSGALGVGVGLGLQRIAGSYVSGFILLLDRSLRIGDVVAVDKHFGVVMKISTRYTILRAPDGTDAVIPNEMFVGAPVVNYTLGDRRVVLSVDVPIGPNDDLPLALKLMPAAALAQPRVLAEPPPTAILKEFVGGNLVLQVSFSIDDPEMGRQNVQSDVAVAVYESFRANGIDLPAPRADFQFTATAVGTVPVAAAAPVGGPAPVRTGAGSQR
jgi:small-conductance mechanosensitive channel